VREATRAKQLPDRASADAPTFLRHIRVASVDELKARILQGIDEMNEAPVQFRWRAFDLELSRDANG